MTKLFVSYSRVDTEFTERLVARLRRASYAVWYDDDLHGGALWWQTILTQIAACDVFVYLLSNESVTSPYCQAEFAEAKRLQKPVVTIQIRDKTELSGDLGAIQYVDMKRGIDDENIMRLVGAITTMAALPVKKRALWTPATALPTLPKDEAAARPHRPEVETPLLTIAAPTGATAPKGDRSVARAMVIGAAITGVLGIVAVVIGILASVNNTPPAATATLTMTTPAATIEVGLAPTETLTITDTTAPTDTFLPPTPSETPTLTPNATEREETLRALMLSIQNEQTLTLAVQERATADSLTATADSWTDTPTPTLTPTTDHHATAAARLTATEIQRLAQQYQTATADSWTDTPTVTATPTLTRTPTRTPTLTPLQLASTPIASNAAWEPVPQDFDGVTMVLVPAGCFMMGSDDGNTDERPVHEQCFPEPFWIDQTEVTQADFERLGGVKATANGFDGDARPVERITWFEARDFCALRGGRLPTEAEWEYAARGPDNLAYPWGDIWDATKAISNRTSSQGTADVGTIATGASWVGALDMSGNVWEWVSSLYQSYPYVSQDGREDYTNRTNNRVLRGGSWVSDNPSLLRAAYRLGYTPDLNGNSIGVRCALS